MSLGKSKIPNMKFLYYMITIMCALKLQPATCNPQPATCNPQPATCKLDIFLIQGIQIGFYVWTLVGCIYPIASSSCCTWKLINDNTQHPKLQQRNTIHRFKINTPIIYYKITMNFNNSTRMYLHYCVNW